MKSRPSAAPAKKPKPSAATASCYASAWSARATSLPTATIFWLYGGRPQAHPLYNCPLLVWEIALPHRGEAWFGVGAPGHRLQFRAVLREPGTARRPAGHCGEI